MFNIRIRKLKTEQAANDHTPRNERGYAIILLCNYSEKEIVTCKKTTNK